MNKIIEKISNRILPLAQKIEKNKSLTAIKHGFIATMPILLVGAFAVLLNSVILDWGEGSLWQSLGITISPPAIDQLASFQAIGNFVIQGANSILALVSVFTIAYYLAREIEVNEINSGILALATFFVLQVWQVPTETEIAVNAVNPEWLGTGNIITAMIIGLIVPRIFKYFVNKNIVIKMPESVPQGVADSFIALIPGTVILFGAGIISFILMTYFNTEFSAIISYFIATPLQKIGQEGIFLGEIYYFFVNLLWFFGIHGPSTLKFFDATILTPAAVQNGLQVAQNLEPTLFLSDGMSVSMIMLGGSGATLGLISAIFIGSRREDYRAMAKFSLVPSIFNINEPLIFGLPIVLNPILFIPFLITTPILLFSAYIMIGMASALQLMPLGAVLVPWVTPFGLSAFLAFGGSFIAVIIAIIQLIIATLIYLPFVIAANRAKIEK